MENLILRKVGDPEPEKNKLPHGVHAVVVGNQIFFVRRIAGRFLQLPKEEQELLKKNHISYEQ